MCHRAGRERGLVRGFETIALSNSEGLAATVAERKPEVVLLKEVLPHHNGRAAAMALAQSPSAKNVRVILYDDSGIHKPDARFPNVDRFVPSHAPADLLKAIGAVTGTGTGTSAPASEG